MILPCLEGLRTDEITDNDINDVLKKLVEKGYSYNTVLKGYRLMKSYFKSRISKGTFHYNPMGDLKMFTKDYVDKFSKKKSSSSEEIRILTDEEIDRIRNVCYNGYSLEWEKDGKKYKSKRQYLYQSKYFLFVLFTGLRGGEAIALKYKDIDCGNNTMAVTANITSSKKRDADGNAIGGIESKEGTPKTKSSKTTVPISNQAVKILLELLEDEPKGYSGYIAHNKDGTPLCESAFRKRFANLLRQSGVEHCGLHTLRHTFASKLYEKTKDIQLVSKLMRHSKPSITQDIYVHITEQSKIDIKSTIEKFEL